VPSRRGLALDDLNAVLVFGMLLWMGVGACAGTHTHHCQHTFNTFSRQSEEGIVHITCVGLPAHVRKTKGSVESEHARVPEGGLVGTKSRPFLAQRETVPSPPVPANAKGGRGKPKKTL
jgi:hypothetical protein